ncbi:hypothetical protein CFB46_14945 [Burkholderia sp. HI2761]|nr:hypothetical protein CFB46_14945 [Burkholderia sp. HI2761]
MAVLIQAGRHAGGVVRRAGMPDANHALSLRDQRCGRQHADPYGQREQLQDRRTKRPVCTEDFPAFRAIVAPS